MRLKTVKYKFVKLDSFCKNLFYLSTHKYVKKKREIILASDVEISTAFDFPVPSG